MKYELTLEQLYEIVLCIVHNELDEDEACDYMLSVVEDMNNIEDIY